MRRTRSVTVVGGASTLNCPASFVNVPIVVPEIETEAEDSGAPPSSDATRPVIRRCCACTLLAVSSAITANTHVRVFTSPPGWRDQAGRADVALGCRREAGTHPGAARESTGRWERQAARQMG